MTERLPLQDLKVLDFSTLLPGPLASLMLSEAGASVIKFERPGSGDGMRKFDADFAVLNRGKRSVVVDLKDPDTIGSLLRLVQEADVLIEQFRPGVMDRLGLGYDTVRKANPRLIYCSINGYGSSGPRANDVGHDLNYIANAGLLSVSAGADGAPVMPSTLIADIGGGAYPAVINILLAVLKRFATGEGSQIEVAMAKQAMPFMYPAHSSGFGRGNWPAANDMIETGSVPWNNIYRTRDGRFIAAAPVEDKFWAAFCDVLGIDPHERDEPSRRAALHAVISAKFAQHTSHEWLAKFHGKETACCLVLSFEEAVEQIKEADPAFYERQVTYGSRVVEALPLPVIDSFRRRDVVMGAPSLGEHTAEVLP